jgi:hypothetical protein
MVQAESLVRLPPLLSDLVFNYIACARAYGMCGEDVGNTNEEEEELALDLLCQVFSHFGLGYTREQLLADVEART